MSKREIPSDFEKQWERRRQALDNAAQTAPDEERMRLWAKLARQPQPAQAENGTVLRRVRPRWVPYAAAAACVAVLVVGGLRYFQQQPAPLQAEKVTVDGEQLYFLCNNQCAAAEVVQAAREMFDK
ncbi:MAG: hypothetical protein IKX13_01745 [Bacteroidales bacterium]|nr:hypothetical protein [Bacteroidales bacterium]